MKKITTIKILKKFQRNDTKTVSILSSPCDSEQWKSKSRRFTTVKLAVFTSVENTNNQTDKWRESDWDSVPSFFGFARALMNLLFQYRLWIC